MTENSLVIYIGGQNQSDEIILSKDAIYTVSYCCHGNFGGVWLPAVYLYETGDVYAFYEGLFKEIDPPQNINIEELISQTTNI